ncbi:hypothetical protein [Brucella pseudogrignonensis]|uniref:hypothetical protein n=1 Tax=Brucella pseudogrignonensis TaxID=419475 RepID=UPI0038CFD2A4
MVAKELPYENVFHISGNDLSGNIVSSKQPYRIIGSCYPSTDGYGSMYRIYSQSSTGQLSEVGEIWPRQFKTGTDGKEYILTLLTKSDRWHARLYQIEGEEALFQAKAVTYLNDFFQLA